MGLLLALPTLKAYLKHKDLFYKMQNS